MRRRLAMRMPGVVLAFGLIVATDLIAAPRSFPATGNVEIAFTPGDAVDNLIIAAIDRAQSEVLVQAYTFTHRRIAQALVSAKRRGVAVSGKMSRLTLPAPIFASRDPAPLPRRVRRSTTNAAAKHSAAAARSSNPAGVRSACSIRSSSSGASIGEV